jgi:hypothetical protein
MIAVEKGAGDGLRLRLDSDESAVLGHIVEEMLTLLQSQAAEDPVTKRLFPDAYRSQKDAAAYHELVSDQLRSSKISALETVRKGLEDGSVDVLLEGDAVDQWLTALTDLRLALGNRREDGRGGGSTRSRGRLVCNPSLAGLVAGVAGGGHKPMTSKGC